jgi:choline-sulfatase
MPTRPHILFICTDQQRYDTLGCYGNTHVQTPTLDRLASEGVLFEQCYVQSPVCAPSRASLLTGRYVHAHGLWANGVTLPAHEQLVGRALTDAGYDCGLIGKLHLAACEHGRLEQRLDDGFRTFVWAHDPYPGSPENQYHHWLHAHFPALYAAAVAQGDRISFDRLPTEAHYSHWVAEQAIDFLRAARDPDKPFCLFVNFFDPHHPFGAPQDYIDRYDPATLPQPIGYPDELAHKPPILSDISRASYAGHAPGFTTYTAEQIQAIVAAYYAMVTLIDDETARILATLDAVGLRDDTLVVFTSDHGEMLGDHQLLLKGPMMYEGAVRVPLILRWPGHLPAGERRADPVQWVDLSATLLDAAGAPPMARAQGQSVLPLAHGDTHASHRDWALCEYRNSGHPHEPPVHTTMLRHGRYKLIVYHGPPATARPRSGELYDLQTDPHELHNLWDDPQHKDTRMELQELLLDVWVATEDHSQPRVANW